MTGRTKHLNKKTGVTYVYESTSYWDKEKKQARNKQVCIGKLDPVSGELIPSKRFSSTVKPVTLNLPETKPSEPTTLIPTETVTPPEALTATAQIVGPSMVLDSITETLGLEKVLKSCFPQTFKQIMVMAYYLLVNGGPLSHCSTWCKSHAPQMELSLTSQRISEILRTITTDKQQAFLKQWMNKVLENDFLCYDISSISSYSELNEYIKYGYNRDKEKLPQLNLAILFGQKGGLPAYYNRLPGNVTDVTTVHNLLKTFKALGIRALNFVMDRGFYSKRNVDELLAAKDKFLVGVPMNNKWLQHAVDEIHETIQGPEGYRKLEGEILYVHTRLYPWGEKRHRCYLHIYFNAKAKAEALDDFNEELLTYKEELESGNLNPKHKEAYEAFFSTKTTLIRGTKVTYNMEAIRGHIKRYTGFYALLTNSIKDPVKALQIYRDKDIVEKSFDDLKNQLDMKRLRVHSSNTADGRLFVQFIALICMSSLRREMRKSELIAKYTIRELLNEMGTLTQIKYSGKYGHILTELTKPQREILKLLNITLPGTT